MKPADLREYVPDNRGKNRRILGFRFRNILEGVVESIIVSVIILSIPFVAKLKVLLITIIAFFIMIFNAIGYRNKSWIELILLWSKYRTNKLSLKLRSPADDIGKNRIKIETRKIPFFEKFEDYFSESNLNADDQDTKRILAKTAKGVYTNLRDNLDIFGE